MKQKDNLELLYPQRHQIAEPSSYEQTLKTQHVVQEAFHFSSPEKKGEKMKTKLVI